MKTTKIIIRNLFGIKECDLDGKSVELSGPKGSGKTSVLDSIRLALTNRSERDYIIHQGADEGEIIIETDSGLSIDRKVRTTKADSVKVKDGNMLQTRPAEFLSGIFTPLQLNPVEFCQLSRQEKNRVILSLIEFSWDLNWIQAQFGEIPQGIDYAKHILEVLSDIQSESGTYFQSRQNINRDIRNKQAFIADIAKDIPPDYDFARWDTYPVSDKYKELEKIRSENNKIERAKTFRESYNDKLRGLDGEKAVSISAVDHEIEQERQGLKSTIERLKAEIKAAEDKLSGLDKRRAEKVATVEAKYNENVAVLQKNMGVAEEYVNKELEDVTALSAEISEADAMRAHLNEYKRMRDMQAELDGLVAESEELTRKIDLARELPSTILEQATLPIDGLNVENGIPLINGLPISNLSDGELLELCVDISVSKPGQLQIILIDGAEKLDSASRQRLYDRCKAKGLQLIATRTTDSNVLEVTEL